MRGQRRREKEGRGKLKITHNAQNIACGLLAVLLCREGDSDCLHSGLHTSALAPGKIGKRNENDNTLGGGTETQRKREKSSNGRGKDEDHCGKTRSAPH